MQIEAPIMLQRPGVVNCGRLFKNFRSLANSSSTNPSASPVGRGGSIPNRRTRLVLLTRTDVTCRVPLGVNAVSTSRLQEAGHPISANDLLRPRMPELDTIRGIAVLLVLFFHGFGFPYGLKGLSGFPKLFVAATLTGWVGVNLFFVLSGFLITGILLDTKSREDYYRRFYIRRALRILPLYYAVLGLLSFCHELAGSTGEHPGRFWDSVFSIYPTSRSFLESRCSMVFCGP